jgi:phosphatidylserine/phosphatidylglycerophosphate/cardiolipin synthase-like enzyme
MGRLGGGLEMWFGSQVSEQICRHHRRRLERIGWERALDPPDGGWADGGTAVRSGNSVEVLVDGANALPRIAEELQAARSHVHMTGWYFSPDFALTRDGEPEILRNLLAELAERVDVRVLVWAGAPLPLFRPSRRMVREMRRQLVDRTKIQCSLDSLERPMHCHHEKTIVIDDRIAFVGGMSRPKRIHGSRAHARAYAREGEGPAGRGNSVVGVALGGIGLVLTAPTAPYSGRAGQAADKRSSGPVRTS